MTGLLKLLRNVFRCVPESVGEENFFLPLLTNVATVGLFSSSGFASFETTPTFLCLVEAIETNSPFWALCHSVSI